MQQEPADGDLAPGVVPRSRESGHDSTAPAPAASPLSRKSNELNAGHIFMVRSSLARDMPPAFAGADGNIASTNTPSAAYTPPQSAEPRRSSEQGAPAADAAQGAWPLAPAAHGALSNASVKEGYGGKDGSVFSVLNGPNGSERAPSAKSVALSMKSRRSASNLSAANFSDGGERRSGEAVKEATTRPGAAEEGYFTALPNGKPADPPRSPLSKPVGMPHGDPAHVAATRGVGHAQIPMTPSSALPPLVETSPPAAGDGLLKPPGHASQKQQRHRASSPPAFDPSAGPTPVASRPDRLTHRHTLEVPKVPARTSKDGGDLTNMDGLVSATGRFSPNTTTRRRGSLQLARRQTRSIHSDMHLEEIPQDEDAARWAEHIRNKRASKKQRVDTDEDRVVVGTKVDQNHVNFVTAYNMLTGIRCCVSRINAKLDRDLTDADFEARHKHSFDISGSELTPSSKYDFKFKDYAPWVFRKLRQNFKIDPADYLMSLTSKYILSELGSPGKSGSFFYFSRDYKYIIKTIHHGEHKLLRKILKDYYRHVTENPNTLLSQFYGLHRVKIPYGRKIHFVVMNNLFPPHRDVHRTFDLKGSTVGRDYREEELEKNPRATLKDLNWLRGNLHLEFGPTKKQAFVHQMQKDVALLRKLKIMDYSLLVGIHDLERGNEENLRDKTLRVFQPGGGNEEPATSQQLARTPSKLENARRVREMRDMVKKERPVPISQTLDKLPEEPHRSAFYFYADDGGFRATHEDDMPGEEIYYLGIIDCLTRYNLVKRVEHFWKGMGGNEAQISPIPPERYGDRFVKFISGVTMSRERAERERLSNALAADAGVDIAPGNEGTVNDPRLGGVSIHRDEINPPGTEQVIQAAEHMVEKMRRKGSNEDDIPDRSITTVRSPGGEQESATLPVIGEAAENISNAGSRTPSRVRPEPGRDENTYVSTVIGNADMTSDSIGEVPPPTPPKMDGSTDRRSLEERLGWGGRPPPTPPKDKALPLLPEASTQLSASPMSISPDSREESLGLAIKRG